MSATILDAFEYALTQGYAGTQAEFTALMSLALKYEKTTRKDLGRVTAYGYAKSKGYTGTEEEFAELMASYATVAEEAADSASEAEGYAEDSQEWSVESEAWATGQRNGVDVDSEDETYHNNSKYYSEQSLNSAEDSEAYAFGKRGGVDVASSDPAYHNNAKYYSEEAAATLERFSTDTTLTIPDRAADAKKTGDEIEGLKAAIGSPLVITDPDDFEDANHQKVYVYAGTTTELYTEGDWYYWDGDGWESGGVYNSVAVDTDDTLSVQGMAADAAVVGGYVDEFDYDIDDLKNTAYISKENFLKYNGLIVPPPFESGARYVSDGVEYYTANTKRLSTKRGAYMSLKQGDVISIDKSVLLYYGGGYTTDGGSTFIPVTTKSDDYTIQVDGLYFFWLYKIGEADFDEDDIINAYKYIIFKRDSANSFTNKVNGQISGINNDLEVIDENDFYEVDLPTPEGAWIRYSDGEKVSSDATNLYIFKRNLPNYIKAFLASDINVLCAIAFYNTETISTSGYMSDKSVDFASGTHNDGLWYTTKVPVGCKAIAITTKKPSESVSNPKIKFDSLSPHIYKVLNETYFTYPLKNGLSGWIRHGTGELVVSDSTKCYTFKNNNFSKIKVFTKSDTSVIDAVSFYSGDTISTDTYLDSSVSWDGVKPNGAWYEIEIPPEAVLIAVSVVKPSGSYNPEILFSVVDTLNISDNRYVHDGEIEKSIREINDVILSDGWKYIYHFGMESVADRSVVPNIPSQSVFDIRNAYNLGYKCIEANVHKTYDGEYVVTHGINGCLGHDFDTLEGEDAYGVSISENTLETLRENYLYRSTNPDYRNPITTLEEFCHEAKKYNMIVMFQYKDNNELEIIKGIMGKRFFMYVAPRSSYDGPILEYLSYETKEDILNRCNTVGRPYIYSMANTSFFTDSELQDIINTLHQNGYYIATAYIGGSSLKKLSSMGFDFFAVSENDVEREVVLDGRKIIFNLDGSVSWEIVDI